MKLPADAVIALEKATRYLLLPQPRGDKSRFLARGGYDQANAGRLVSDLRSQILPLEARHSETTFFGDLYEIRGVLVGPSGKPLRVRTIWIMERLHGAARFVTLYPDKTPSIQ